MVTQRLALVLSLVVIAGCSGEEGDDVMPPGVTDMADDLKCPPLYAQGLLPEFHVTIAASEWAAMQSEFEHRAENEAAMMEINPYHPIQFRYGDAVAPAMIRLKGQSSWLQAIALDDNPKMQFVISFNEVDPKARFMGVRKLDLDMPRGDFTFLQQRIGLYQMRRAGVAAQCANNARVVINGEYYGLYTNLERFDKEFLQRNFGDADEGDLWEGGRIIKTNEETFTWRRLDQFWHVTSLAELMTIADIPGSIPEWAAEVTIGHADGVYNGRANYFLYDHPTRGFLWLPNDLDTTFNEQYLPAEASPLFPDCSGRNGHDREHYLLVMDDPVWRERYLGEVAKARAALDVGALQARVDAWSAQIAASAATDPHRPFALESHTKGLAKMRDYIARRAAAVDAWLACRQGGGRDGDNDGFTFCFDCQDGDPAAHPGVAETCNARDDDCNGRTDEGLTCN